NTSLAKQLPEDRQRLRESAAAVLFERTGRREIGREQQLVSVAGVEQGQDHRYALGIGKRRDCDPVETDKSAPLGQLFGHFGLWIVETANMPNRDVLWFGTRGLKHIQLA